MSIYTSISDRLPVKYLRIAKNTLWSLSGQIFPLLAAVLCIPILLANLGTERFGFLSIAWMVIGYFSLFDFGLGRALTFIIARNNAREVDSSSIINASLKFMVVISLFITAGFYYFVSDVAINILNVSDVITDEAGNALKILSLGLPFVILSIGFKGILEANLAFKSISCITIPSGICLFVFPAVVSYFSTSLVVIFATLVVIRFFQMIFLSLKSTKYFMISFISKFYFSEIKDLLKFGSWMTVTNAISPIMVNMDRFFIGVRLTVDAVSYYVVPFDMITKALIVPSAISTVFFPEFSREISEGNYKKVRSLLYKAIGLLSSLMFFPLLIIWFFSYEILSVWISAEFSERSYVILKILCVGVFFNAIAYLPFSFIQGGGRSDLTAKVHIVELCLYLPFVFYMIDTFGVTGAAYAWTLRVLVDLVLMSAISFNLEKL